MKKSLVSLLSDQVIPCTLFCRQYADFGDDLFIVTSDKMNNLGKLEDLKHSLSATGIKVNLRPLIIKSEESLEEVTSVLKTVPWSQYRKIIVDVTLGNKIMSLATYSFFYELDKNAMRRKIEILYQPIAKNHIVNLCTNCTENLEAISIEDYLLAYGIKIESRQGKYVGEIGKTQAFFSEYLNKWKNTTTLFRKLRNAKKPEFASNKGTSISQESLTTVMFSQTEQRKPTAYEIGKMRECCEATGFDPDNITKRHIEYLSGGWFEEWFHHKIIEIFPKLKEDQVALSLHIETKIGVKNELDIALVSDTNAFLYVECKTSLESDEKSKERILVETLYKQSSIKNNFGLKASPLLATMDSVSKNSDLQRAKNLGIRLVDRDIIGNDDKLKAELTEWLG